MLSFETESTDDYKAEWRKRPEVPTTEELMRDVVDLPMNVIDGPYRSVDEYLETHYELLREDAFSGLRDAVGHMRKAPESDDTQDVAIYENVSIYNPSPRSRLYPDEILTSRRFEFSASPSAISALPQRFLSVSTAPAKTFAGGTVNV